MIKNIKKLTVKYNDRTVGILAEVEEGKIAFQYDEKWVKNGFSISPISLPLNREDMSIVKIRLKDCTEYFMILCPMVGGNFSSAACWRSKE